MWETPFFKPLLQRFYFHVIDAWEYGSEHKNPQLSWPTSMPLGSNNVALAITLMLPGR